MTLQEFFNFLSNRPLLILVYFTIIPAMAYLMSFTKSYKRTISPLKETYSILIFLVAVPGLMAFILNIYLFLFERQSIWGMNLFTQALPIISFIFTVIILKRQLDLDEIPGFDKLSGLLVMIFVVFSIMWVLDRTRIHFIAFTYMPIQYVLAIFIGLLVAIRFGWKKFIK